MDLTAQHSPSVSETLARSGARLDRAVALGRGLSLAEWRNADNVARYDRPDHHTFSLYLTGGEQVLREDKAILGGGPDKFCLLPAGHESRWRIGGPLYMFHLYVDPELLSYRALTAFDIDPRGLDLADLTFRDDPAMAMIVRGGLLPLDWEEQADRPALDAACHLLIHHLIKRANGRVAQRQSVRGGLSPVVQRRIACFIDAHLDRPLTLDSLATEAGLSTFHFAKMFRLSFGLPPHQYLAERRVERAKALLAAGERGLAEIALACGYASQSHFTRAFKAAVGLTPGAWRRLG